ncbi:MAG: hypothetical protein GX285_06520 [Clostridiales bacterium]|nr:hypothetical protein [Clostridiales bacterium]
MGSKLSGKFEAAGRAGVRDKENDKLVAVYPYKVWGTDQEIKKKVKDWFYERNSDKCIDVENYYVDVLNPVELKNAKEKFID